MGSVLTESMLKLKSEEILKELENNTDLKLQEPRVKANVGR